MLKAGSLIFAVSLLATASLAAKPYPGTTCTPFPADSWWQADVSQLPVHARSKAWVSNMQPNRSIWPDFGPSFGEIPGPYGIPVTVVSNATPKVAVRFQYSSESDKVRYPLGGKPKVEGWQWRSGDRHVIMINKDTCRLYETWATAKGSPWRAGSGATWSLDSNALRPINWTSADAAGLPIYPGLLRLDEVQSLNIGHAIRFTTPVTNNFFIWPARHKAGSVNNFNYPPMGARFRLKASYVIKSNLRAETKAILRAMKTYGLVLADNGSPWFFQGEAKRGWNTDMLGELKRIPASAFEAVDTSSLRISRDSMQVKKLP